MIYSKILEIETLSQKSIFELFEVVFFFQKLSKHYVLK